MLESILKSLVDNLKKLPGIGSRTAQRMALQLVSGSRENALELAGSIREAVESITTCSRCNMLTQSDPCAYCTDPSREDARLCIVETAADVLAIERLHEFRGRYFVLGKLLSPIEGIGPDEIHIPGLMRYLEQMQPDEVILALNPSTEGEATMEYIATILKSRDIGITRLSTGIPFGGDLEYTSPVTLSNAFKRRFRMD